MTTTTTRNGLIKNTGNDINFAYNTNSNMDKIDDAIAKCNFAAATDPGTGDDGLDGYAIGSLWYNNTGGRIFACQSATNGNAVWRQIWPPLTADLSGTITNAQLAGSIANDKLAGSIADAKLASSYLYADGTRGISSALIMAQIATPDAPTSGNTKIYAKADGKIYKRAYGEAEVEVGAAPDLSGYMVKSLIATRGDIVCGSADDTPSILTKGDQGTILYAGANDPAYLAVGSKGQVLATGGASANPVWLDRTPGLYYNAIINSQFQVNQRAVATYTSATTPANSDDTYTIDQWVTLSDGNDIADESQEFTIVPTGAPCCLKLEIETANKKIGKVFFLENKDALKFAGKSVSLQLKARTTTGKAIRNIRAAVLSWDSTADTLTSDVVASWGAEGTNPTLATHWTAENTAENLVLVADTWTTYKIENIAIDTASMTNLAVFIWIDDTDAAVDDLLYIGDVQLNEGAVCLPFSPKRFSESLWDCLRFLVKSYAYATALATSTNVGSAIMSGFSADIVLGSVRFPRELRIAGSISIWSDDGTSGAVGRVGTGNVTPTTIAWGTRGIHELDKTGGFATNCFARFHYLASGEL